MHRIAILLRLPVEKDDTERQSAAQYSIEKIGKE